MDGGQDDVRVGYSMVYCGVSMLEWGTAWCIACLVHHAVLRALVHHRTITHVSYSITILM